MQKIKLYFVFFLTIAMPLFSMHNPQPNHHVPTGHQPKPIDATQEVNDIDSQITTHNDKLDQTVIHNFANIVQSFIHIVQQPENPTVIGTSIAQMLSGILNVAVEIFKKIPHTTSKHEQEEYLEKLEHVLSHGLKLIKRVKTSSLAS